MCAHFPVSVAHIFFLLHNIVHRIVAKCTKIKVHQQFYLLTLLCNQLDDIICLICQKCVSRRCKYIMFNILFEFSTSHMSQQVLFWQNKTISACKHSEPISHLGLTISINQIKNAKLMKSVSSKSFRLSHMKRGAAQRDLTSASMCVFRVELKPGLQTNTFWLHWDTHK